MASNPYIAICLIFLFAVILGLSFVVISSLIGRKKYSQAKMMPYECGINPVGEPRAEFSVKFFLVAMLFIIFDVEVVFLYPWAVLFKDFVRSGQGVFVLTEMMIFLGILMIGLIYIYGKKALKWE
jgi:NADH-quinone oxidoreductase subunit A